MDEEYGVKTFLDYYADAIPLADGGIYLFDEDRGEICYISPTVQYSGADQLPEETREFLGLPTRTMVSEYFEGLSDHEKGMCEVLRGIDWNEADIYRVMLILEDQQEEIRDELMDLGRKPAEINRLEDLCFTDLTISSRLKRPGKSLEEELCLMGLFVRDEIARRRSMMLGPGNAEGKTGFGGIRWRPYSSSILDVPGLANRMAPLFPLAPSVAGGKAN